MKNTVSDPKNAKLVAELKTELARLRKELDDHDQFAGQSETPPALANGRLEKGFSSHVGSKSTSSRNKCFHQTLALITT